MRKTDLGELGNVVDGRERPAGYPWFANTAKVGTVFAWTIKAKKQRSSLDSSKSRMFLLV